MIAFHRIIFFIQTALHMLNVQQIIFSWLWFLIWVSLFSILHVNIFLLRLIWPSIVHLLYSHEIIHCVSFSLFFILFFFTLNLCLIIRPEWKLDILIWVRIFIIFAFNIWCHVLNIKFLVLFVTLIVSNIASIRRNLRTWSIITTISFSYSDVCAILISYVCLYILIFCIIWDSIILVTLLTVALILILRIIGITKAKLIICIDFITDWLFGALNLI